MTLNLDSSILLNVDNGIFDNAFIVRLLYLFSDIRRIVAYSGDLFCEEVGLRERHFNR